MHLTEKSSGAKIDDVTTGALANLSADHTMTEQEFAVMIHTEALRLRDSVGRQFYTLAVYLWRIKEDRLWKYIDPELRSFEEYLEQYGFGDWNRTKAFALLGQVKDLLPRGATPEQLGAVGWSKVEVIRPAVRKGLVPLEQALADARTLGRNDLRRKYQEIVARSLGQTGSRTKSCYDCLRLRRADIDRGDRLVAFFAGQGVGVPVYDDWRYCPDARQVWIRGPTESEAEAVASECTYYAGESRD